MLNVKVDGGRFSAVCLDVLAVDVFFLSKKNREAQLKSREMRGHLYLSAKTWSKLGRMQQDNDPKHISSSTSEWLKEKRGKTLERLSRSSSQPDRYALHK